MCRRAAAIALVLLAGSSVGPLKAQQDTAFLDAVVEFRIMGGPAEVFLALVRDSVVLLPLQRVLELSEVGVATSSPGLLVEGVLEPEGTRFVFDTERSVLRHGGETTPIDPGHATWRGGMLYVGSELTGRALDVEIFVNWVELVIVVRHTDGLPVIRRLLQERRREVLLRTSLPRTVMPAAVPSRLADGAVLDWAISSGSRDPRHTSAADLGLGVQVIGGSLTIRHTERRTILGRSSSSRASWFKAWANQPAFRQLWLGDVTGTGRRGRVIRGGAVTNSPFVRSSLFGGELLTGQLPPDWEVELYHGDRLTGFSAVDETGRYQFSVPVSYGSNPLNLIGYGPHGERLSIRRTFEVPAGRLRGRQFEYGVSGGECLSDPCEYTGNVDLRYGVSSRLTVRTGADIFGRDTLPDLWHPYLQMSGAVGRSINVLAEAVYRGLLGLRVDVAPTQDLRFGVQHRRFVGAIAEPIVGSAVLRNITFGSVFWRPARTDRGLFFRGNVFRTETVVGTRSVARLGVTRRVSGVRTEVAARYERQTSTSAPTLQRTGVDAIASASLAGGGVLRGLFVRAMVGVDRDSALAALSLELGRQISSATRLDLSTSWHRGRGGLKVEFGLTMAMPTLRAVSRNRYTAGAGVEGVNFAEGSILWDRPTRRVVFGDGRSLGRAGLVGQVFLDENGNGIRDPEDFGIPGIALRAGGHGARTDSLGRFTVWDVMPFEAVVVAIDSNTIDNPLWVPATPAIRIYPHPNGYNWVDLPLVVGGELNGRVVFGDTKAGAAGTKLILRHQTTGEVLRATAFSDGSFFFLGLRPGGYELTVDSEQLTQLAVTVDPVLVTFERGQGESIVSDVVMRLQPR